jgi:hypothetical protein
MAEVPSGRWAGWAGGPDGTSGPDGEQILVACVVAAAFCTPAAPMAVPPWRSMLVMCCGPPEGHSFLALLTRLWTSGLPARLGCSILAEGPTRSTPPPPSQLPFGHFEGVQDGGQPLRGPRHDACRAIQPGGAADCRRRAPRSPTLSTPSHRPPRIPPALPPCPPAPSQRGASTLADWPRSRPRATTRRTGRPSRSGTVSPGRSPRHKELGGWRAASSSQDPCPSAGPNQCPTLAPSASTACSASTATAPPQARFTSSPLHLKPASPLT